MGFESNYGSTRIAAPNPSALNVLTGARYSALKPKSMREQKSPFRVLTESGPLVALTVAVALLVGIAGPASAQLFQFRRMVAAAATRGQRRLVQWRYLRTVSTAGAEVSGAQASGA